MLVGGLASVLLISACTETLMTSKSCDLKSEGGALSSLHQRACDGDRQALYALGVLFEEGRKTPQDAKMAAGYYRAVSFTKTNQTAIYVPGYGSVPASSRMVQAGAPEPAIPDAQYRLGLMYLEGRGVKKDMKKAMSLLQDAAKKRHAAATEALTRLDVSDDE